ncbi:MAG: hypothetical protein CMJ89_18985 [Planctomycetes bacterium]|nr:hypothetical protein [Planctomycetota bacterium]
MVAELRKAFPDRGLEVELTKSSGGAFEVFVEGRKIFSKLELKRFPAYQEIPLMMI